MHKNKTMDFVKKLQLSIAFLCLSFYVWGCSTVADSSKVSQIIIEKTTSNDIIKILGTPMNKVKSTSLHGEAWSYWYKPDATKGGNQQFIIVFDMNMVVKSLTFLDFSSKTVKAIQQLNANGAETNSILTTDGATIQIASIDGDKPEFVESSANGVKFFSIKVHGGTARETLFPSFRLPNGIGQYFILPSGDHDIEYISGFNYRGIDAHIVTYFDPGKEYNANFRFDSGNTGFGQIIINNAPIGQHGWSTIITNKM
jgi:hypothetical protein